MACDRKPWQIIHDMFLFKPYPKRARRNRSISRANSRRSWAASSAGSQLALLGKTICHIRASRSDHGIRSAARAVSIEERYRSRS